MIVKSLNRVSAILRSEDEWMEALVTPLYDQAVAAAHEHQTVLWVSKVKHLPAAALRRIVRRGVAAVKGDLRRISYTHILAITRLIESGPMTGRLDLPDRISVRRAGEHLVFSKEIIPLRFLENPPGATQTNVAASDYDYEIREPGKLMIREIGRFLTFEALDSNRPKDIRHAGQSVAFFDKDRLHFPLRVRNFRPGDRFVPLGMAGTQKLKKYFNDNKILPAERIRCPLLLSGGKIIWVVGHRMADSAKILPTTQRVLKVELGLV